MLDHLRAWSTAAEELGEPPLARILDESLPKFLPYDHIYLRDDEAVQPTQVHRPTTDRFGNARADPGFDVRGRPIRDNYGRRSVHGAQSL